eukprot:gene28776-34740_t
MASVKKVAPVKASDLERFAAFKAERQRKKDEEKKQLAEAFPVLFGKDVLKAKEIRDKYTIIKPSATPSKRKTSQMLDRDENNVNFSTTVPHPLAFPPSTPTPATPTQKLSSTLPLPATKPESAAKKKAKKAAKISVFGKQKKSNVSVFSGWAAGTQSTAPAAPPAPPAKAIVKASKPAKGGLFSPEAVEMNDIRPKVYDTEAAPMQHAINEITHASSPSDTISLAKSPMKTYSQVPVTPKAVKTHVMQPFQSPEASALQIVDQIREVLDYLLEVKEVDTRVHRRLSRLSDKFTVDKIRKLSGSGANDTNLPQPPGGSSAVRDEDLLGALRTVITSLPVFETVPAPSAIDAKEQENAAEQVGIEVEEAEVDELAEILDAVETMAESADEQISSDDYQEKEQEQSVDEEKVVDTPSMSVDAVATDVPVASDGPIEVNPVETTDTAVKDQDQVKNETLATDENSSVLTSPLVTKTVSWGAAPTAKARVPMTVTVHASADNTSQNDVKPAIRVSGGGSGSSRVLTFPRAMLLEQVMRGGGLGGEVGELVQRGGFWRYKVDVWALPIPGLPRFDGVLFKLPMDFHTLHAELQSGATADSLLPDLPAYVSVEDTQVFDVNELHSWFQQMLGLQSVCGQTYREKIVRFITM